MHVDQGTLCRGENECRLIRVDWRKRRSDVPSFTVKGSSSWSWSSLALRHSLPCRLPPRGPADMSGFLSSIPTVVGRSVLSPINALPKRFSQTQIVHGDGGGEDDDGNDSATQGASTTPRRFTSTPLEKITSAISSLASYHPHPLIPLGGLQTIYSAFANTVEVDVVHYKRHVLLLPDGGTIAVDVSPPEWDEDSSDEGQKRKTVVLNHGLTGGSHESYVRHVIPPLVKSGYRCVVVNFRGCGQTPVTAPQMYSAAKTDDLRSGLLWTLARWKQTEIVLVGFSLGANVVAKYLGEEGDATVVKGGLVLATPFDLKMGSDELAKSALYDKTMAANLTKKIAVHAPTLSLDPSLHTPLRRLLDPKRFAEENAEEVASRGVKPGSLKWVDDSVTRLLGGFTSPYGNFPFDSADEYYIANGSIHKLHNVARPLLLLNSDDDPIVPMKILTATREAMRRNPNVTLAITRGGGHLGWWTAANGGLRPSRWLGKVACGWVDGVFDAGVSDASREWMRENDPWRGGAVEQVDVEYELLSEDELVEFDTRGGEDKQQASDVDAAHQLKAKLPKELANEVDGNADDEGDHRTAEDSLHAATDPRHAWLKTRVLPHAPLVHPSHAKGWKGVQYPREQETRRGTMHVSTSHRQIGFLELPVDARVAGCGEVFQGGKSIPGQTSNTKGERVGGRGKRGLREEGTVAGL